MYSLIVLEIAENHAFEAGLYYEKQQSGLGERFLSELESVYKKIIEHPQYYGFIGSQNVYRNIGVRNFPFTCCL